MGDQGGIEIQPGNSVKVITEDNGFIADVAPQYKKDDPYAAEHAHFIECIRDPEKPLRTCGRQGVVLQHMLDAIYRSAATGKETAIEIA
jgi:predicted dehydrogenase